MRQVRDLGRYPKESTNRSLAERRLAEKLCRARKAKKFSSEQEAELKVLQQLEIESRVAGGIAEAEEPPNPMEGFAEEAESRIDQDLMLLESGIRTMVQHFAHFQQFCHPGSKGNLSQAARRCLGARRPVQSARRRITLSTATS